MLSTRMQAGGRAAHDGARLDGRVRGRDEEATRQVPHARRAPRLRGVLARRHPGGLQLSNFSFLYFTSPKHLSFFFPLLLVNHYCANY